jgi:hypothetical protein
MGKYDDIINLPHHVSKTHPQMSIHDRAAQFSSFAALSGFEDSIAETGRIVDQKIELDDDAKALLNRMINEIELSLGKEPKIKVVYFCKDKRKDGGTYLSYEGIIRRIDRVYKQIHFKGRKVIDIEDIIDIHQVSSE